MGFKPVRQLLMMTALMVLPLGVHAAKEGWQEKVRMTRDWRRD